MDGEFEIDALWKSYAWGGYNPTNNWRPPESPQRPRWWDRLLARFTK